VNEEPIILCPNCGSEIKLTESLAAPLIAETRKQFEIKLTNQQQKFDVREFAIKAKEQELENEKASLDAKIDELVKVERKKILDEEKRKAASLASVEIEAKTNEITELQELVKQRTEKLAEAP
jgi:hypothetical protein